MFEFTSDFKRELRKYDVSIDIKDNGLNDEKYLSIVTKLARNHNYKRIFAISYFRSRKKRYTNFLVRFNSEKDKADFISAVKEYNNCCVAAE